MTGVFSRQNVGGTEFGSCEKPGLCGHLEQKQLLSPFKLWKYPELLPMAGCDWFSVHELQDCTPLIGS